jgi:hypothetical protein
MAPMAFRRRTDTLGIPYGLALAIAQRWFGPFRHRIAQVGRASIVPGGSYARAVAWEPLAGVAACLAAGLADVRWLHSRHHDSRHRIREDAVVALDNIIIGMRRVIDELPAAEREGVLTSPRAKSRNIAGRLEALRSRNH